MHCIIKSDHEPSTKGKIYPVANVPNTGMVSAGPRSLPMILSVIDLKLAPLENSSR